MLHRSPVTRYYVENINYDVTSCANEIPLKHEMLAIVTRRSLSPGTSGPARLAEPLAHCIKCENWCGVKLMFSF